MTSTSRFTASGITKSFGAVQALRGASLDLRPGEIHALCGENGAGKSTLSKVACGVLPPDQGEMSVAGEAYSPRSLKQANQRGVSLVFQESTVVTMLSVAENVHLGRLREFRRLGFVSRRGIAREANRLLEALGAPFDVDARWDDLGLGERKMLEIARAIATDPEVLFVDEATAVLDARGRDLVMESLRRLRDRGTAICYVSHHLEEIFALADRITVMRDGQQVATVATADVQRSDLETLMVGRDLAGTLYPSRSPVHSEPTLELRQVGDGGRLRTTTFIARAGEILGIAGLAGSGGTELLRILAGDAPARAGSMSIQGRAYHPRTPRQALARGVGYLPGDRDGDGLLGQASIRDNVALASLAPGWSWVERGRETEQAEAFVGDLGIKASGVTQAVDQLSGGNRQKVVLSKILATAPKVLLLDNPTRGVDVGARSHIYRAVAEAADRGMTVVLLSEDLLELLGLADRLLVMRRGEVSCTFDATEGLSERDVLAHML